MDKQAERIRIKDIAHLAGVSVGTVDVCFTDAAEYLKPAGKK